MIDEISNMMALLIIFLICGCGMGLAVVILHCREQKTKRSLIKSIKENPQFIVMPIVLLVACSVAFTLTSRITTEYPEIEFEQEFTVTSINLFQTGRILTTEDWTMLQYVGGSIVFEDYQTQFIVGNTYHVTFTAWPKQSIEEIPHDFGCELVDWRRVNG